MSAAAAKRPLELNGASAPYAQESAVSETSGGNAANTKKAHSSKSKAKVSLDEETKNKRTAQNRAAQRAFRERKERKMKELEQKVNHLQDIQKQSEMESEFLRGQLFTLVKELKRFRPETSNDSEVLNYLAKHEVEDDNQQEPQNISSITPPDSASATAAATAKVQQSIQQKMNFSFSYPFNEKNGNQNNNTNIPSPDGSSTYSTPNQQKDSVSGSNKGSVSGSAGAVESHVLNNNFFTNNFGSSGSPNDNNSTDASTPSMNWLDNILYSDNMFNEQLKNGGTPGGNALPILGNGNGNNNAASSNADKSANYDSNLLSNEFNFDENFDEQVTDFCVKMNQVCGTRQDPVPKTSPSDVSAMTTPNSLGNSLTNSNITIPSSVGSSKKASFGELSFSGNGANTQTPGASANSMPFINDALAFPSDSNDFARAPISSGATPATDDNSKQTPMTFDPNEFFRAPNGSMSMGNSNDMYNQFIASQDEDKEDEDEEDDSLAGLISEEPSAPAQPPMPAGAIAKQKEMMARASAAAAGKSFDDDDEDGIVVPSKDDDLLKCSEIWDRITSHPKYSDIDIDGLCGELMAKAKCSERGVVVNASDVQLALSKHMA